MSAAAPAEMLRIDAITLDTGTQVRAVIDPDVVDDYAQRLQEGVEFPPVVVFRDGSGTHLADGFHRVPAHRRAGRTEIAAHVHDGTVQDALWFALGANRTHGHRLTCADKAHAVKLALAAWPDRSQRRIGDQVGCSHQYVGKIRAQVETSCHLSDRTVGTDGKSYPARQPGSDSLPEEADAPPVDSSRGPDLPGRAPLPKSADLEEPSESESESGSASDAPSPVTASSAPAKNSPRAQPGQGAQRAQDSSNKIVSRVVSDVQELTAQKDLFDFALDRAQLPVWIADLEAARRDLGHFIRRLRQEASSREAAAAGEDPSAPD